MKGKLIIIEGMDYVGKSTLAATITSYLRSFVNANAKVLRSPGGTNTGEYIRTCIMKCVEADRKAGRSPEDAGLYTATLFMAGFNNLITSEILPRLEKGEVVVLDRLYLSTLVYQGYSIDSKSNIATINAMAELLVLGPLGDYYIDATKLLIDSSIESVLARRALRPETNSLDPINDDEILRRRAAYLHIVKDLGYTVIDNSGEVEVAVEKLIGLLDDEFADVIDANVDAMDLSYCLQP